MWPKSSLAAVDRGGTNGSMVLSPRLAFDATPALRLSAEQLAARDAVATRLRDGTYPVESAPCPCGARRDVVLAERDRYGLPVRTVLCRACGIARTDPRMTAEATARFYAEHYRALYTGSDSMDDLFDTQVAFGRALLAGVAHLLPPRATVVEIGCGPGGNLLGFAEAGHRVIGLDLDTSTFHLGRRHGLDLREGTAFDLVASGFDGADLVILHHVLEHFLDPIGELSPIRDLLADDGLLWVEVPGLRNLEDTYLGDFLLFLQNAHTFHFTAATLRYVLARAGLEAKYVDERARALATRTRGPQGDVPPPAGDARTTLVHLRRLERRLAAAA